MNIEIIKEIAKQSIDTTSTYSSESYDGPEDDKIDLYCVLETDPVTYESHVLYISRDIDQARCYLLCYIKDIEKGDFKKQFCYEPEDRVEYYQKGMFYGKTLKKIFKICKHEH